MKTPIVPVSRLTQAQRERMFELMFMYYEKVTWDCFLQDLSEKSHVILLQDKNETLWGFSTIVTQRQVLAGHKVIALFSGDTILHESYWGNGALASAFGRFLVRLKLLHPLTPIYYFLISKGYKTYLLIAKNFANYFPRWDRETPQDYLSIMDEFYGKRFGPQYDREHGLILPKKDSAHLKSQVACIAPAFLANPEISFFQKRNEKWAEGYELACIAKVTLAVPIGYALKRFRKMLNRQLLQGSSVPKRQERLSNQTQGISS